MHREKETKTRIAKKELTPELAWTGHLMLLCFTVTSGQSISSSEKRRKEQKKETKERKRKEKEGKGRKRKEKEGKGRKRKEGRQKETGIQKERQEEQ